MKKLVKITHEGLKAEMLFCEVLFGSGKKPAFEGELLAVNPSPEEFAKYDENFKACVEAGDFDPTEEGVVYYDNGAGRAFWVSPDHVEIMTLN